MATKCRSDFNGNYNPSLLGLMDNSSTNLVIPTFKRAIITICPSPSRSFTLKLCHSIDLLKILLMLLSTCFFIFSATLTKAAWFHYGLQGLFMALIFWTTSIFAVISRLTPYFNYIKCRKHLSLLSVIFTSIGALEFYFFLTMHAPRMVLATLTIFIISVSLGVSFSYWMGPVGDRTINIVNFYVKLCSLTSLLIVNYEYMFFGILCCLASIVIWLLLKLKRHLNFFHVSKRSTPSSYLFSPVDKSLLKPFPLTSVEEYDLQISNTRDHLVDLANYCIVNPAVLLKLKKATIYEFSFFCMCPIFYIDRQDYFHSTIALENYESVNEEHFTDTSTDDSEIIHID